MIPRADNFTRSSSLICNRNPALAASTRTAGSRTACAAGRLPHAELFTATRMHATMADTASRRRTSKRRPARLRSFPPFVRCALPVQRAPAGPAIGEVRPPRQRRQGQADVMHAPRGRRARERPAKRKKGMFRIPPRPSACLRVWIWRSLRQTAAPSGRRRRRRRRRRLLKTTTPSTAATAVAGGGARTDRLPAGGEEGERGDDGAVACACGCRRQRDGGGAAEEGRFDRSTVASTRVTLVRTSSSHRSGTRLRAGLFEL